MVVAPDDMSGPDYNVPIYRLVRGLIRKKFGELICAHAEHFLLGEWFVRYRDRSVTRTFI